MKSSWSSEIGGSSADSTDRSVAPSFLRGLATLSGMAVLILLVGFLRNAVIAAVYGTTREKDAFDVAAGGMQWLLYLFGLDLFRSMSGAIFARLAARKDEDPSEVLSSLLTVMLLVGGVVVVGAMVLAGGLAKIMVSPEWPPEDVVLCRDLLRLLLPGVLLGGVLGLFSSILNAYHKYAAAELGNLLLRLLVLVVVLGGGWFFPIHVLAMATLVGLFVGVVVQWFYLRRLGFRYRPSLSMRSSYVREAAGGALPLLLAMVVGSTGEVYLRRLISYGDAGVVASYGYATVICGLSIALLARPVGQTFAPRIGRYAGLDEVDAGRRLFGRTFRLMCLLVGAAALVFAYSGWSLTAAVFHRGEFDSQSVSATATILAVLIWVIFGQSVSLLCVRCFYAFGRTWRLLAVFASRDVVRIPLAVIGFRWLGPMIVPVAIVVGSVAEGLAGLLLVRPLLRGTAVGWLKWLPKYLAAMGSAALAGYALVMVWKYNEAAGFSLQAGRVVLFGVVIAGVMFGMAWAVRMEEATELLARIGAVLRKACGRSRQ